MRKKIKLSEMFSDSKVRTLKYCLPIFLSVRGYGEITLLKKDVTDKREIFTPGRKKRSIIIKHNRPTEEVLKDYKIIKDGELMDMLSVERADNYSNWMEVGWCLYNIGQGTDEFLDLWREFSQRSLKFVDGECEEQWARMTVKDMSLGSLRMWAKHDNPERYAEWTKTQLTDQLIKSLREPKPNEWEVATVVKLIYRDRFCCVDPDKRDGIWYEFHNHRWHAMPGAISLRNIFATDLVNH
jgi:hypothetical protein